MILRQTLEWLENMKKLSIGELINQWMKESKESEVIVTKVVCLILDKNLAMLVIPDLDIIKKYGHGKTVEYTSFIREELTRLSANGGVFDKNAKSNYFVYPYVFLKTLKELNFPVPCFLIQPQDKHEEKRKLTIKERFEETSSIKKQWLLEDSTMKEENKKTGRSANKYAEYDISTGIGRSEYIAASESLNPRKVKSAHIRITLLRHYNGKDVIE